MREGQVDTLRPGLQKTFSPTTISAPPSERVDCTVKVACINAFGRAFSNSFIDWSLPKHQRAILKILKANGGQIHIHEFMRQWDRMPIEDKI